MLGSLISEFQDRDTHWTVYSSGEPPDIVRWLSSRGVAVESRSLPPGGPDPFIELSADDEVVGVIGVEAVEALLEPPIAWPDDRNGVSEGYGVLFETLEKTRLSGLRRRELLAVSREIEHRAYRVGDGTLRVSFQTLSTFRSQTAVYRALTAETDLEVHIYGVDDWTPPAIAGITYHGDASDRFEPYWALAYDGGPDSSQACGLVAEQSTDGYTGFWTSDPAVVDDIATALDTA